MAIREHCAPCAVAVAEALLGSKARPLPPYAVAETSLLQASRRGCAPGGHPGPAAPGPWWRPVGLEAPGRAESKHPIGATSKEGLPAWLHYMTSFFNFLQCLALWDFHPLKIFSVRWNFMSFLVMLPPRASHHGECCCRLQGRHSTPCEER